MNKLNIIKKKIVYRSEHRGTKEMDLILSKFVDKYIDTFNEKELSELESLLNFDDEILCRWYLNKKDSDTVIPINNITKKLKRFKL